MAYWIPRLINGSAEVVTLFNFEVIQRLEKEEAFLQFFDFQLELDSRSEMVLDTLLGDSRWVHHLLIQWCSLDSSATVSLAFLL